MERLPDACGGARYLFTEDFRLYIFGSACLYLFHSTTATFAGVAKIMLPVF
jgi:hypothetical protein